MRIFLQDSFMVAVVLCMVVVDVIVLIIGTSLPQTRFTPQRVPDREFPPYRNVSSGRRERERVEREMEGRRKEKTK